jgi:cytochrome c biogenesis protein CcdA
MAVMAIIPAVITAIRAVVISVITPVVAPVMAVMMAVVVYNMANRARHPEVMARVVLAVRPVMVSAGFITDAKSIMVAAAAK